MAAKLCIFEGNAYVGSDENPISTSVTFKLENGKLACYAFAPSDDSETACGDYQVLPPTRKLTALANEAVLALVKRMVGPKEASKEITVRLRRATG